MTDVTFHSVQLPVDVEKGAHGGPNFHTSILVLSSGKEKRNIDWSKQLCTFDISYGIQSKADAQLVLDFFYARFGRAYGFRFKDWGDYEAKDTYFASGDGVTTVFQASKRYSSGPFFFDRKLTRLVQTWDTGVATGLPIKVDGVAKTEGVNYTVDYETGLITFSAPPGVRANATLTNDGSQVNDGDIITINATSYRLKNTPSLTGDVKIGSLNTDSMTNLFHAINKSGGVPGTDYIITTANPDVVATNPTGTTVLVTAKLAGTAPNSYITTETSAHLSWGGGVMVGGTAALLTLSAQFDVPVRFDTDKCDVVSEIYNAQAISSLTLTEIKE